MNVIKLQQETEAIPCHSPQASPGPGEQGGALCSTEPPASTEPVAEAEERAECVCEHRDLVPAPAPGWGILGKKPHFRGQVGLGVKGLLCWLGMLSGSTSEPASSTRNLLGPSLGCQETEVGTEDQPGGHTVAPWPGMELYEQLFPGLSQLGGSSNPSPASLRQLLQSAAAAISRVQSEWLLPGSPGSCPPEGVCRGERGG